MHRPAVVTGHIVAQCVEGHIRAGQVASDDTFDVTQQAGGVGVHQHGARVHEDLDRLRPGAFPPQQAERVGLH